MIMWWYIPLGALVGLLFGLAFGTDKPEKEKEWKPKKNLFDSISEIRDISHSPSKRFRR